MKNKLSMILVLLASAHLGRAAPNTVSWDSVRQVDLDHVMIENIRLNGSESREAIVSVPLGISASFKGSAYYYNDILNMGNTPYDYCRDTRAIESAISTLVLRRMAGLPVDPPTVTVRCSYLSGRNYRIVSWEGQGVGPKPPTTCDVEVSPGILEWSVQTGEDQASRKNSEVSVKCTSSTTITATVNGVSGPSGMVSLSKGIDVGWSWPAGAPSAARPTTNNILSFKPNRITAPPGEYQGNVVVTVSVL